MRKALSLLGIVALAAAASGQSVQIPNGFATGGAGSTSFTWRNTAFHFQMFYDSSHFLDQGVVTPITITRLQYQATGGATSAGGETYTGVNIQMSSSPSSWMNPNTTFANNRGTDNTVVFSGNVVATPALGGNPNDYILDITLQTPFTYDPLSGTDFCIEVDAPMPIPATMPNMAASSNASHKTRRLSTASQTGTTGGLSYWANVVLMDYTPVANAATFTKYGEGCYDRFLSFYEHFPSPGFDLSDTAIQMLPIGSSTAPSGYNVLPYVPPSAGNWFTPSNVAVNATGGFLADDELSQVYPLGFSLYTPGGGVTADVMIGSNGYVFFSGAATAAGAYYGNRNGLLTAEPRAATLWGDLDPSVGGTVYADTDPATGAFVATWDQVPEFGVATALSTVQTVIYPNGTIEYRYQTCTVSGAPALVGFSPGVASVDPGSIDISTSLPLQTAADVEALALNALRRPVLGGTFMAETSNIPPGALLGAHIFSFGQINPGTLLPGTGNPGCYQYLTLDSVNAFIPTGATEQFSIGIPTNTSWVGMSVYTQSVALEPGINALNAITSNGGVLFIDVN